MTARCRSRADRRLDWIARHRPRIIRMGDRGDYYYFIEFMYQDWPYQLYGKTFRKAVDAGMKATRAPK